MATSSSKQAVFWQADWFAGILVVLAVLGLHAATDLFSGLERRYYDFASTSTDRQPSDRIAIIAIDDQSIRNLGRWPWPRDLHAELIDKLVAAKAKTIAHTVFFLEPETDRGLVFIRQIKKTLDATPDVGAGSGGLNDQLKRVIVQAELALDTDAKLATSVGNAGNVLLPSVFALGEPQGPPDKPLAGYASKSVVKDSNGNSLPAVRAQLPLDGIGSRAAGTAHLNQLMDVDGAIRREPLLIRYGDQTFASMALLAAAHSLNLSAADIRYKTEGLVQVGELRIATDSSAQMLPQFYRSRTGKPVFQVDSFYDVITGKIPAASYAGKVIIIGATAAGVGTQFATPAGPGLSPAEAIAHITSSILSGHFLVQPGWGSGVTLGLVLLVAAYLMAGLPRLTAGQAALVTLLTFTALMTAEFILLSTAAIWVKLVFPAALLLVGHLALTTKRFLMTEAGKLKSDEESAETNRMMGLALQGQGHLEMAFDRFRRVPFTDALLDNLNNLALDFERKRQFNKAQAIYEYMSSHNQNHKDLQLKLSRAKSLSDTVILGRGSTHPGGVVLAGTSGVEKPTLGRYQLEKELGKGAMGVVYLGKDSTINRLVAIKTLALSHEFEGQELEDARQRFFREAETAGRLQHQNIVTIFDAGEEHDLAYIAMEFLQGNDLSGATKNGQLLPVVQVLSIVARVAEALAYAHRHQVVHRDIKPANIMYDQLTDSVKVTDFGIARIRDSSKTKTGLVLGTPSFMSPEQIAGKHVDGRSDLYSLGVMLFQMLTGVLPFQGESMAELLYKISHQVAPDIQGLRKDVPDALANIVAFSLAKRSAARYQNGDDFASDLWSVVHASPDDARADTKPQGALIATASTYDATKVEGLETFAVPDRMVGTTVAASGL